MALMPFVLRAGIVVTAPSGYTLMVAQFSFARRGFDHRFSRDHSGRIGGRAGLEPDERTARTPDLSLADAGVLLFVNLSFSCFVRSPSAWCGSHVHSLLPVAPFWRLPVRTVVRRQL